MDSIELNPDNCYAFAKLSRAYAGLYLNFAKLVSGRLGYNRTKAVAMIAEASATETPDPSRSEWLKRYLIKNNIMD